MQNIKLATWVLAMFGLVLGLLSCSSMSNNTPEQPVTQETPNNNPQPQGTGDQVVVTTPVTPEIPQTNEDPRFLARIEQEKVRLQQQNFLVQDLLKAAKKEAEFGRFSDAYYFVLEALKIKPEHIEALQLKKTYGQKLGYRPDEVADQLEESIRLKKVQIDQTNLEVDNRMAQGRRLMREKKYSEAVSIFRRAKDLLRWLPYHVPDLEGKGQQLDHLIQTAEQEDLLYQEELKKQRMLEAEEQTRREEQARLSTLQEQIRNLYRQANLAFEQEKYDLAENFCQQVTILDPENKDAVKLIDLIRQARHAKVFEQTRFQHLEEWKRTFAIIDDAMVPTHEIVTFPSYEEWKTISRRGSKTINVAQEAESPQDTKIRVLLETESLPRMDFNDAPLREVVDYLRTTTNINIIIDPEIYKEFPDEESLKINLNVTDLKLNAILNWMLTPKGLTYRIANGVLIITTKKRDVEKTYLKLYNVRDLTGKLNDFPGMEIDLTARQTGEGSITGISVDNPDARPATTITEEQLTNLIKDNISKGSWKNESNSIEIRHGTLIIRQTADVHRQIESLLNDLRKATGLLVTIEARFLTVSDDFLEDVGVDWRSLGATATGSSEVYETSDGGTSASETTTDDALKPGDIGTGYDFRTMDDVVFGGSDGEGVGTGTSAGLYYKYRDDLETRQRVENIFDETLGRGILSNSGGLSTQIAYIDEVEMQMILSAVRKRSRSNLVTAPRLTVFNTQRANVTVVNQIAYVQDYEVEIATKATIADPVIGTIQDGVILDVRPIISADRKYITIELQPTVAILKDGEVKQEKTALATSANNGSSPGQITIELPDISMTKIRTTVTIPDGGTLMLGGVMEAARQDYMSGVPILSDLPLVNFFTSRQGQFSHKQSLMILVTARITSMEEKEPNQGLQR